MNIEELINTFKDFENQTSDALNRFAETDVRSEEHRLASKKINILTEERRNLHKELFKNNKSDDMYDYVHDSILDDGEDMPVGYKAIIIDSYYDAILRRNHTIAQIITPKEETYFIDVPTYKRVKIGTIYK
jgi:hypothetical protein